MALTLRRSLVLTLCLVPLVVAFALRTRTGGPQTAAASASPGNAPKIRVRLLTAVDTVTLTCNTPPLYQLSNQPRAQKLNSPANAVFTLTLTADGWQAGNAKLGGGGAVLHLAPETDGAVSVNGVPYRGKFRFVPAAGGKFDCVNDVDVDSYLLGVVAKECLPGWHDQTYRAQAIVARTYALYEKQTAPSDRSWDVYPDTRSQMYGGIPAESSKSRAAVADTAGVVIAAPDAAGQPHIFKAYFSSSCGGVSLSAADAFGSAFLPALSDQDTHAACRASPRFHWGPVVIDKSELTKRFAAFGKRLSRPEQAIGTVTRIDIQDTNRFGRPTRFLVTDARGNKFSLTAEEFRWAVNATAPETLFSSYLKIINDSDKIRFVEGHGHGHGVGLCQYTAEKRAQDGLRHEDILMAAYPTAILVRAY